MAFFGNLVKLFIRNNNDTPRKRLNPFVRVDTDPMVSWENVDVIGDGAFGKVHKARHKMDNHWAALKEIALDSDEDLEDLKVEIEILVSCRHKHIVELLEAYLFENRLWLYLEFCGGGALDSIMQDLCRGLSEPEIRHVCHCVLDALVFLHSRFVIHRDLKAGNILLTAEGVVKLADFGVSAKNTDDKQRRDTFIGTPFWMAPEVIMCETNKDDPYDNRADVWSLGITLIELAEMNPPHHEMHPMRLMIKVQRSPAPELSRPKRWSTEFSAFLKRCLVKDPNLRAWSSDLVSDPFISDVKEDDTSLMRQLVLEVHGEYEDTVEEGVSASALHQSTLSLGSLDKLSDAQETESNESNPATPQLSRRLPSKAFHTSRETIKEEPVKPPVTAASATSASSVSSPSSPQTTSSSQPPSDTRNSSSTSTVPSTPASSASFASQGLEKTTSETVTGTCKPAAIVPLVVPTTVTSQTSPKKATLAPPVPEQTQTTSAVSQTSSAVPSPPQISPKKTAPAPPIPQSLQASSTEPQTSQTSSTVPQPSEVSPKKTAPAPPIPQPSQASSTEPQTSQTSSTVPHPSQVSPEKAAPAPPILQPSQLSSTELRPSQVLPKKTVPVPQVPEPSQPSPSEPRPSQPSKKTVPAPPVPQPSQPSSSELQLSRPSSEDAVTADHPSRPSLKHSNSLVITVAPPVRPKPSGDVRRAAVQFEERAAELVSPRSPGASRPAVTSGMNRLIQGFESMAKPPPAPPLRSVSMQAHHMQSERSAPPVAANGKIPESPKAAVAKATVPSRVPLESFAEEIYSSVLEEVFKSETEAPSFPVVVLDVMKEEFEAMTPTPDAKATEFDLQVYDQEPGARPKKDVQTTDIDTIVVTDNRTKPEPESENTVRVGGGYGTVSAIVSNATSTLEVRDNREGAAASGLANGQGDKEQTDIKANAESAAEEEDNANTAKMADRRRHSHYRTLTRVRKFIVDGEERTTTTTRVVVEGLETKEKENYDDRKAGIREMRLLQKQEQRQQRDLLLRSQGVKNELEQRLKNEELALQRQYESELEVMQRQHKVQLERAETEHTNEIRYASRRVKTGHERELRKFRDSLKQEIKSVRHEVDLQPKERRKEMLRARMEEKELEHAERERDFQSELAAQMSAEIDRMTVKHRKKLGQMENNFLRLKHNLRRRYEEERWHLEQSHMYTRHQKAREQLEEYFALKRDQTANKQMVERNHLTAMIAKDKAFLLAAQNAEKKRVPKALRTESKTRLQMFRQSLRIPGPHTAASPEDERERLRTFEEAERERLRSELDRMARKQTKKLEAMQLSHSAMLRELEQLQAEKKKELMDAETAKMREIDENFQKAMTAFQHQLKERRQALEAQLEEEIRRQQEFYTLSDDGPNVQIRELPVDVPAPVTDLDAVPVTN